MSALSADIAELIAPEDTRFFERYVSVANLGRVANAHFSIAPSATSEIEAAMSIALCQEFLDEIEGSGGYTWFILNPQFHLARLSSNLCFVLDFLVTVDGRSIGVECDGKAYHDAPSQRSRDAWRDQLIKSETGLQIIRFTGSEIITDARECAAKVRRELFQ